MNIITQTQQRMQKRPSIVKLTPYLCLVYSLHTRLQGRLTLLIFSTKGYSKQAVVVMVVLLRDLRLHHGLCPTHYHHILHSTLQ